MMATDRFSSPARRADAERNRDKILAAARTAFADPEAEVSMAEVSRRAGVGMATLYRNFPGRRELLEALFTEEADAICRAAETLGGQTPGATLTAWLQGFFAFAGSKRHIASELLKHTDSTDPVFGNTRTRVLAVGRPLLAAAQHAGEVRDDLALEQILDMIVAIAAIHADARYVEPILETALDGLRPQGDAAAAQDKGGSPLCLPGSAGAGGSAVVGRRQAKLPADDPHLSLDSGVSGLMAAGK
jgi:AcrR family transcriptional regulator